MEGILRNRWIRVQGVAMVLYVFSQIDKANIAVAYPGIRGELGLTAAAVGFATGMFAWGYLVLQIPVGRLTSAWSAKRTILILCACWSIVAASTALVQTETQLIVNRFVLGMSEGGILPAVVVVMRAWFTQRERARANLSLLGTPIALAIGNSVCGFAVESCRLAVDVRGDGDPVLAVVPGVVVGGGRRPTRCALARSCGERTAGG